MPLLEQLIGWGSLLLFFGGILFMHLRLRNKASFVMLFSFISTAAWISFSKMVFDMYVEFTADPKPANQTTAEAFMSMSTNNDYDMVFFYVQVALSIIFCVSFFLSARSIPRLTTQSR